MATAQTEHGPRPRAGDELVLEIDSLAHGGPRRRARRRLRRLRRRAALPGRPRARRGHQGEARLRRGARGRAPRPERRTASPTAASTGRALPGRAVAGPPLRAPARTRRRARSTRRCAGSAASTASSSSRSCPAVEQWRYRNKLEYSFGERDGELVLGFHRRGSWAGSSTPRTASSPRSANNAARNEVRDWARGEGIPAYDRPRPERRPAQPRRPRGPAHRPDPDPPGHLPGQLPQAAGRPAHGRSRDRAAAPTGRPASLGEERLHEELCGLQLPRSPTPPSSRPTPRWPSASTRSPPSSPASAARERVFDLYCGIGTIGLTLAARAGEVWGMEIVPEAIADAERNARRNGIDNARFVAGERATRRAAAARAGRQARRRRRRPARAPGSRRRSSAG